MDGIGGGRVLRYIESQADAQFTSFLATHQVSDFSPIEKTAFNYYKRDNQTESSN